MDNIQITGAAVGSPTDSRRIAYIDGLRALAVLSVLADHVVKYSNWPAPNVLRHLFADGSHGVDLFFVISGFCLAYPALGALRERGKNTFDVAAFAARRLVRIMPPYWAAFMAVLLLAIGIVVAGHTVPSPPMDVSVNGIALLLQLLFLNHSPAWVNGSFWTLAVELRWYIVFPGLLWLWCRSPRAFMLVAVLSLLAYHETTLAVWDFATLPAFMSGIVAADLAIRRVDVAKWATLGGIAALGCAIYFEPHVAVFNLQDQIGWQIAAFCLVLCAGSVSWIRALFSLRVLTAIGIASYSIYLVHEPIVATLDIFTRLPAYAIAGIALTAGLAFWFIVERPFTDSPLRDRLRNALKPMVVKSLSWLGLQSAYRLTDT